MAKVAPSFFVKLVQFSRQGYFTNLKVKTMKKFLFLIMTICANATNTVYAKTPIGKTPIEWIVLAAPEHIYSSVPDIDFMEAAPLAELQQETGDVICLGKELVKSKDGSQCIFGRYIMPDGKKVLAFNYSYSYDKNYTAHVKGIAETVCTDPNFDDISSCYLLYTVLDPNAKVQGMRMCKINGAFADYIQRYAQSKEGYGSIGFDSKVIFRAKLGDDRLNSAPMIKDEVQYLKSKSNGKKTYITPKY